MKSRCFFTILVAIFLFGVIASSALAKKKGITPPQLLPYNGKTFKGEKDPEYVSYDLTLRNYLVKRIGKHFGISLDAKTYSGFELLELEALLKCKKSDESYDLFLKMFPKQR